MKIAYVVNQYPPMISSGLGRYVEEVTPHLAAEHRLTVFTLNDGHLPVEADDGEVRVYRPIGFILRAISRRRRLNRTRRAEFLLLTANVVANNWRYVRRLRRTAPDERPDLVAVHDSTNFLSALLCHHLLRLPVVLHVHTTEYGVAPQRSISDPFRFFAALERRVGRIARRVVVATEEVREQLTAAGWAPNVDVVLLGGTFERVLAAPGFDRDRLRASATALRAGLGIAAQDPVLLFVGRLERQKGIYPLLEAMRRIAPAVPGLRLVMLGEGDAAGVNRIVAGTGLAGRVIATGEFVTGERLMAHYELADACVFPSLYEPFGLVATESMALGKATILGDGFPAVYGGDDADRPAVRYVRTADPDDIARTVIEVMTDPELRRRLGERAERFVAERLSWARTAADTTAIYRAAAGRLHQPT
jgi:glycosyltransferase involved in cell wall biosynthesis